MTNFSAAADNTLEILAETDALANIAAKGEKLRDGIHRVLIARGIRHSFVRHPAMSGLFVNAKAPSNYREWVDSDYAFLRFAGSGVPRTRDPGGAGFARTMVPLRGS